MERNRLDRGAARTAAELRVQLAQMTTASQMLERNAWDEKGKGYLAVLNQGICRMLRIVGRLELCERLAGDDAAPECAPVDLAALTTGLCERMEGLLVRTGVELTAWSPERLTAWADEALVEQLLLELTANAAKAGKRVNVTLEQVGDTAVFTVEDDGPGVPPERLGELFPRAGGERPPDWRKNGSGIAVAQRIARLHGGTLMASCAPGRGLRVSASILLNRGRGDAFEGAVPGFDSGGFDPALVGLSHLLPADAFRPEDYE